METQVPCVINYLFGMVLESKKKSVWGYWTLCTNRDYKSVICPALTCVTKPIEELGKMSISLFTPTQSCGSNPVRVYHVCAGPFRGFKSLISHWLYRQITGTYCGSSILTADLSSSPHLFSLCSHSNGQSNSLWPPPCVGSPIGSASSWPS